MVVGYRTDGPPQVCRLRRTSARCPALRAHAVIVEGEDRACDAHDALCSLWWGIGDGCQQLVVGAMPAKRSSRNLSAPGRPITAAERWSGAETFVGGDRHPGFAVPRHCRVDRLDRDQDVVSSNAARTQGHWEPKKRLRRCCRRTRLQCPRCRVAPCRHLRSATSARDRPAPQEHGLVGGSVRDLITQPLPGCVELTRDRHTVAGIDVRGRVRRP